MRPVARVRAPVVHGDQRVRLLGFPTANLALDATIDLPPDGVYVGQAFHTAGVRVRGQLLGVGAVSIGTNATFNGTSRRLEVFILDLYGQLQEINISSGSADN